MARDYTKYSLNGNGKYSKRKGELVDFLKDQRNRLAEADRSIEEIKAADALIEGECEIDGFYFGREESMGYDYHSYAQEIIDGLI